MKLAMPSSVVRHLHLEVGGGARARLAWTLLAMTLASEDSAVEVPVLEAVTGIRSDQIAAALPHVMEATWYPHGSGAAVFAGIAGERVFDVVQREFGVWRVRAGHVYASAALKHRFKAEIAEGKVVQVDAGDMARLSTRGGVALYMRGVGMLSHGGSEARATVGRAKLDEAFTSALVAGRAPSQFVRDVLVPAQRELDTCLDVHVDVGTVGSPIRSIVVTARAGATRPVRRVRRR